MPRMGVTNCITCNYIGLFRTITGGGLFLHTTKQNTKKLILVRFELSVTESLASFKANNFDIYNQYLHLAMIGENLLLLKVSVRIIIVFLLWFKN